MAARYTIDLERQTLYGGSFGGLMVLRQLFRNPEAYSTYVAASPSIWWKEREILDDEAAFVERVKVGELKIRLLLTSAGNEQYYGDDPAFLAADYYRMIDNVSELADRLAPLNPARLSVTRAIFPDETHSSQLLGTIGRALTFALTP